MKSEKQQLLDRVLLMMKYDSNNTLSENYKKIIKESVDSLYSQSVTIDNLFQKLKAGKEYEMISSKDSGLINKEILKKDIVNFSCEITKTPISDLIYLLMKKADNQKVYPTSEEFYASERGNNITITMWLIETYLFAALKYKITNKQLTNKEEQNWGLIIRVPTGTKTEIVKTPEEYLPMAPQTTGYKTRYHDTQKITTERQAFFDFNDKRYQEYINQLQNGEKIPAGPEMTAIPSNDWKLKLKYIFNKDIDINVYSICNATTKTQNKEEKKTSVKTGCPFTSVEEENEFRKWVNETYPEIAKQLKINIAAPENKICNPYIIKALDYLVDKVKWKEYKHTGV